MQQKWAEFQGRVEDDRLIRGAGRYVGDVTYPDAAIGVVVRAPVAHARVRSIDFEAARAQPGVLAVYIAADLGADGIGDFPCGVTLPGADGQPAFQARRPVLVRDTIRMVGEPVAFVVAETARQAEAAAELVVIETEDLPVFVSAAAAMAEGAPRIWDGAQQNVAFVWKRGDRASTDAAIAGAAHVVRLDSDVSRVNALSMEPRGCLGLVDEAGRLVLHASNQSPHALKSGIAGVFKVPADQVRVVAGDVGGSFGMKSGTYPEDVLVLFAARRLKRPVRWISERRESFLADDHGRDMHIDAALALDKDGKFVALTADYTVSIGAYLSGRSLFMVNNIGGVAGVYRIPSMAATITGAYTNTMSNAPYRGAGRPEATYTIERLIDMAARELGIDPFELRRRNLVAPVQMPYDTGFVFTYDCGEFEALMLEAARVADRAGFEARREASKRKGLLRGLGIANPIEVAGGPFTKPAKDMTRITVTPDGRVKVTAGAMSTGQGLETMMIDLVGEKLGVGREMIDYAFGDTDNLPFGRGNGGSSAAPVGGSATTLAGENAIATGKAIAAELLEAPVDAIDYEAGRFPLRGTNRSVSLSEVAAKASEKNQIGLIAEAEFAPPGVTFPNGCHFCEVEVDADTGVVRIDRYTVVEDIGTVLNPTLAHGQIQGGVAMGVGQALGEAIRYDADNGQLVTGSFMDYQMPRADDVPSVRLETRPVPTKLNPVGAKGVGEAGTVGSLVAVINAIVDALAPLGVSHIEMPATPARVWAAIQAAIQAARAET
ncbi:MAG: xanthine dehydrogenase family protein molybdopterin-binding subunit [Proteobacteria bacterium]|nr:xanthine dehydrogenase family protein molybdopterin-binding subunit [Pseudomonadota bacterium]